MISSVFREKYFPFTSVYPLPHLGHVILFTSVSTIFPVSTVEVI